MNAAQNQNRNDANYVPLAFQAQIPDRGKIQYAGNHQPAQKWLNEWLKGCPPVPEPETSSVPQWQRRAVKPTAGSRLPEFGKTVQTWEYTMSWRMVTNGGQDDGIIRPVIGARGLPYFSGSSMKGAFRHVCPPELVLELCGSDNRDGDPQPGILRFHGGYPTSMDWGDRTLLVDLVHPQQGRQVGWSDKTTSANVLISLFQPTFKFGISSSQLPPDSPRWKEIQAIWEKALSYGLGSRVSAGYGYVDEITSSDRAILSVNLKGQGLASKLLNGEPEFRSNMFKATLRGHTLRILAGLIADDKAVKRLNAKIWGDTESYPLNRRDRSEPIVGLVGVRFSYDGEDLKFSGNPRIPKYKLQEGKLELIRMGETSTELEEFIRNVVRFSILIGGIGKSSRRVDHSVFYREYLEDRKPQIGCHWEMLEDSYNLGVMTGSDNLSNISSFFNALRTKAIAWLATQTITPTGYVRNWREVWHQDRVQVWGRIAENSRDSRAVRWYHQTNRLKDTPWGGEQDGNRVRKISRSYHRMYPRLQRKVSGEVFRKNSQYVEILTLFGYESNGRQNFPDFIAQQHNDGWIRLW